jgi:hypothetical protein
MTTAQERMQAKLESLGLPYKTIQCYGAQIMVTAHSEETAKRWRSLLLKFATTVRPVSRQIDYAKVNKNTVLKPSTVTVYRVWATV